MKSSECRELAKLFSVAVDAAKTGLQIKVPQFLKKLPFGDASVYRSVWTEMVGLVEEFQRNALVNMTEDEVKGIGEGDLLELLKNRPPILSDFQAFRLLYCWCQKHATHGMFQMR